MFVCKHFAGNIIFHLIIKRLWEFVRLWIELGQNRPRAKNWKRYDGMWVGDGVVARALVRRCEGKGKGRRKNMLFGGPRSVYIHNFKDIRQGARVPRADTDSNDKRSFRTQ